PVLGLVPHLFRLEFVGLHWDIRPEPHIADPFVRIVMVSRLWRHEVREVKKRLLLAPTSDGSAGACSRELHVADLRAVGGMDDLLRNYVIQVCHEQLSVDQSDAL